ncbi:MAG: hypothetical protein HEP71_33685, partial [Roseivirga sp.]|nr:hypothetical protein [Roseivirga sp.]
MPQSAVIARLVETKYGSAEDNSKAYQEYETRYNTKTDEVSKLIIIVLAPLLGILLYALFRNSGLFLSDGFNLA